MCLGLICLVVPLRLTDWVPLSGKDRYRSLRGEATLQSFSLRSVRMQQYYKNIKMGGRRWGLA